MSLQQIVDEWPDEEFTGGPKPIFEAIGRLQLITLLRCGLQPDSSVLDVGCGALRGGYWIIHFLDRDRYFGIEPAVERLQLGLDKVLEPEVVKAKRPTFDHNDQFRFDVFGEAFDFVMARSVWSHASKPQILAMLDQFCATAAPHGRFLTSYSPAIDASKDYNGEEWMGRSHESDSPNEAQHSFQWVRDACAARSLVVEQLRVDEIRQPWLLITRQGSPRPETSHLSILFAENAPRGTGASRNRDRQSLRSRVSAKLRAQQPNRLTLTW